MKEYRVYDGKDLVMCITEEGELQVDYTANSICFVSNEKNEGVVLTLSKSFEHEGFREAMEKNKKLMTDVVEREKE